MKGRDELNRFLEKGLRFPLKIIGLLLGVVAFAAAQQPKGLEDFLDKDFSETTPEVVADYLVRWRKATGEQPEENERDSNYPYLVGSLAKGDVAFVSATSYKWTTWSKTRSTSGLCIHVFDKDWTCLENQFFPLGALVFLKDVRISAGNPMKEKLLAVRASSSGKFRVKDELSGRPELMGPFEHHYYALIGKGFVLVRRENDNRRLVRNFYGQAAPLNAPSLPKRTREEWIATLSAKEPAEVLATLVWLSGKHMKSSERRFPELAAQESVEDSLKFESVRDAEETKSALGKLSNSENVWIRDYVDLMQRITRIEGGNR